MMRTILLASVFVAASATFAFGDTPGPDWISKEALSKKLEGQGYSAIKAEADDGDWEGKAVKDGKIIEFNADPKTGEITKSEPDDED